jgi:hypothetical protein
MYHVRERGGEKPVFKSSSLLQCEMTAISLTLASYYSTPKAHEVVNKTVVHMTVEPELAFAMMQVKMRNLIYNRKIQASMPYVPDRFTDLARTKIVAAIKSGRDLNDVKDRLCEEVDNYAAYVVESLV